jgi:putative DNA primase/helicase
MNSGHNRATAYVIRTVGDDHHVAQFGTWCPKAIALIGELPPTLQDRSIVIQMRRRQKGETVERRRADRTDDLANLCRKAARWAADHADALQRHDPHVPAELDDRAADNWRPLLAIGSLIGGQWKAEAWRAAKALSARRGDDDEGGGVLLLRDIRQVLTAEWLTPTGLLELLLALPESPWAEWRRGKPLTARGINKLLKPFEIASENSRDPADSKKVRRYYRDKFVDAWNRYLPPAPPK